MENQESDTIMNIIYISIFLVVLLLAVVTIISALNQGNVQTGTVLSGTITNESIQGDIGVPDDLSASVLDNPTCTISYVTDLLGNVIPTSNYTVNNCEVTYNP